MSADDHSLLGVTIGAQYVTSLSARILPTRGYRATVMANAIGLDASEIECAEHAWD
jgi:hypothetical protein